MGSVDLPDQPDETGRAERARDASAARPQMQEMPDPDERGRAYEAARAHVSADATDGSYWHEVPKFTQMWADHERRWPERQPAAEPDRPADPAGTYRSMGGFRLDPERHAETIGAIGRMRETEPSISADMQAVEKENACGGWLAGFDRRIKGEDRLKEKVAEQAAAEPDKSSSAILRKIQMLCASRAASSRTTTSGAITTSRRGWSTQDMRCTRAPTTGPILSTKESTHGG